MPGRHRALAATVDTRRPARCRRPPRQRLQCRRRWRSAPCRRSVLAAELVRAGSLDDGQLGCRVELGRREPGRRSTEAEVQVHLEGAARRALGPEIHPRLARTGAVGARDRAPPAAARVDEHRTGAAVAGARDKDARRGEVARTAQDKAERLPAIQAGIPRTESRIGRDDGPLALDLARPLRWRRWRFEAGAGQHQHRGRGEADDQDGNPVRALVDDRDDRLLR